VDQFWVCFTEVFEFGDVGQEVIGGTTINYDSA